MQWAGADQGFEIQPRDQETDGGAALTAELMTAVPMGWLAQARSR
jgi:hypothetical protein